MNLLFAFVLLAVLVATLAEDRDFACNDYNNDCLCKYLLLFRFDEVVEVYFFSLFFLIACIQFAKRLAFQCNFCPVDGNYIIYIYIYIYFFYFSALFLGVCHTVGSLFNKCSNDQCVSLSSGSKCKKKTAADCQNVKYGDEGFAQ
jgi:hypothetical protein